MSTSIDKAAQAMVSEILAGINKAKSPEEAYKTFIAIAGRGIAQSVRDGLEAAVLGAVAANLTNPAIAGWESFITGCQMSMDFGVPVNMTNASASAMFTTLPVTKMHFMATPYNNINEENGVLGGSISVSASYSF